MLAIRILGLTCCWILKLLLLLVVLLLFVHKLLLLLTARGDSNAEFMVCCDKCDADVCECHWSESGSSQGPSLQINNKNNEKLIKFTNLNQYDFSINSK